MAALKALVIIMGVMILAMFAVIVVTVVHRLSTPKATASAAARLVLPEGAAVEGMSGVGEHVGLMLRRADGSHSVLVLDPASGAVIHELDLVPSSTREQP